MGYYDSMNDDLALAPKAGDGKLYKLVQLISILIIVIAAVFGIFGVSGMMELGTTGFGFVLSVGVAGLGAYFALPWVRVLEAFKNKRYKITAIVFLGVIGVCAILWIVCVWLVIGLIKKAASGGIDSAGEIIDYAKDIIGTLNTIRAVIIVSVQLLVSSFIAKNIVKYNKTLITYQVMAGLSKLYIDFFICLLLTAFTITTKGEFKINDTAEWLLEAWPYALLAIACILGIFPAVVFRRTDKRNLLKYAAKDMKETVGDSEEDNGGGDSTDAKLRKIKKLLDKGLITQEEYDQKREDILDNI